MNAWFHAMFGLLIIFIEAEGSSALRQRTEIAKNTYKTAHGVKRINMNFQPWLIDSYCLYSKANKLELNKAICKSCGMCQKTSCVYMVRPKDDPVLNFYGYETCRICLLQFCKLTETPEYFRAL